MEHGQPIHVVTGASGRTGVPLCMELKRRGEFVRALCRSDNETAARLRRIADEVVFGDLLDPKSLDSAFLGAAYVYHLGGIVDITSKLTPDLRRTNVEGTRNVVNACIKQRVKRLVYTCSVHALDFRNRTDVLREVDRFQPDKLKGGYAVSKAEAGNIVFEAARWGLDAVLALPSGVTGAYDYKRSNIGQMIRDVAARRLPAYFRGEYDFVDVWDVAGALADLAQKGVKGESYIVSGHKITVKELLRIAANCAGVKPPRLCVPYFLVKLAARGAEKRALKKGRPATFTPYSIKVLRDNCNFSHEKLTALTGYSPRPLAESIREQVEFQRAPEAGKEYGKKE